MSESAEAVAKAFMRAINRQDVDALAELMTEEHRFVDALGNVVEGRDRMRVSWGSYFDMVPDYTIAVDETHCDGPVVVMLGTAQGTFAVGGAALGRESLASAGRIPRAGEQRQGGGVACVCRQ
jgi:uncharacterized protein (TIGR02246 family)